MIPALCFFGTNASRALQRGGFEPHKRPITPKCHHKYVAEVTLLRSWTRHFTFKVLHPTQVYRWYQRTQRCDPFGALASCLGNWEEGRREKRRKIPTIKRPDGSFAPKHDFTNLYFCPVGTETWDKLWVLRLFSSGKASVSLSNECGNSILMTRHYPDLGSASVI